MFRQDFTCPALLVPNLFPLLCFRVRGYHPLWPDFPDCSTNKEAKVCRLLRVRSPLLAESRLISFPPVTEMFHFTGSRFLDLCIQSRITEHYFSWVAPFGNLRVKTLLQLTVAYRSLTRPSSPVGTKASIMCP
jgi:hypothetical protein